MQTGGTSSQTNGENLTDRLKKIVVFRMKTNINIFARQQSCHVSHFNIIIIL